MKPWMNDSDIKHIESILVGIGDDIKILEWGSGGSTKYFSEFLINRGLKYNWLSLEYNKKWWQKVRDLHIPDCDIKLFDVGNDKLKQRDVNMDEYVNYPLGLGLKFDFILVDGRKRRRCLEIASQILTNRGSVVLHDAQRTYYHCAFKCFARQSMISSSLWTGGV